MPRKNDLENLRLLLHSGIDPMTQMPFCAELLRRQLPSFSLSMIRVDAACAPQEHYSEYFDELSHRLFTESGHHFAAATDDPAAFGNLLRGKVPFGTLIDGRREFLEGATYQHLFKRNGIHHVLDLALRDRSGPLGILGVFRERAARPWTRSDVATAAAIYPSLVHAFRAEPFPASFDETDSAVILVNQGGRIEWATPHARRWLEDATGGPERARLMDRAALPRACRDLVRRLTAGGDPSLALPVPGGRLRLRAYGLSPTSPDELRSRIAIQLRLEMHRDLRILRALETTRLTPQQRRMALGYARGKSPADMARELSVTAATLKSYQKDLHVRLDVGSIQELRAVVDRLAASVTLDLDRHRPRGPSTNVPPTPPGG